MPIVMSEKNGSKFDQLSIGKKMLVRGPDNLWLWSPEERYDLSRPASPDSEPKATSLRFECQVSDITIDPPMSAMFIIDLPNFTLSQALRTNMPQRYSKQRT